MVSIGGSVFYRPKDKVRKRPWQPRLHRSARTPSEAAAAACQPPRRRVPCTLQAGRAWDGMRWATADAATPVRHLSPCRPCTLTTRTRPSTWATSVSDTRITCWLWLAGHALVTVPWRSSSSSSKVDEGRAQGPALGQRRSVKWRCADAGLPGTSCPLPGVPETRAHWLTLACLLWPPPPLCHRRPHCADERVHLLGRDQFQHAVVLRELCAGTLACCLSTSSTVLPLPVLLCAAGGLPRRPQLAAGFAQARSLPLHRLSLPSPLILPACLRCCSAAAAAAPCPGCCCLPSRPNLRRCCGAARPSLEAGVGQLRPAPQGPPYALPWLG